jgi:monoamine oxidase
LTTYAVVGGGIAGLAALARLVYSAPPDRQHRLLLFESSERLGGRFETRDWRGLPVELGAQWIHGRHGNPITRLAESLGLHVKPTRIESTRVVDLQTGDNVARETLETDPNRESAMAEMFLDSVARQSQDCSVAEILSGLSTGLISDDLPSRWLRWCMEEGLGLEMGISPSMFSARRISARHYDVLRYRRGEAILREGYGTLAARFFEWIKVRVSQSPHLSLEVHRESPVEAVGYGELWVRGNRITVDGAVLACPLWTWQRDEIQCRPSADASFRSALNGLGTGYLARAVVDFSGPLPVHEEYLAFIGADLNSDGIPCQWFRMADQRWVGLAYGDGARRLETLGAAIMREKIASLFDRPGWPMPMDVLVSDQRGRGGSFSIPLVGCEARPLLPWAEDTRMVCAGEHTVAEADNDFAVEQARGDSEREFPRGPVESLLTPNAGMASPAVAHGAFYSGLRAADMLLHNRR